MSVESFPRSVITSVLLSRGTIDMPATGTSMYPLIGEGDICCFVSFDPENLEKGDILLYQTKQGQLVAHRFIHKTGEVYQCKGDSNLGNDEWIYSEQIIGKMLYVSKNHVAIHLNGILGKAWTWFVLTFPLVSALLRKILVLKSNQKMKR